MRALQLCDEVRASESMATGSWRPTLRQMLRAATTMLIESIAMWFSRRTSIRYNSAGREINGSFYHAASGGKAPAVLLLHTAFGLTPHEHAMASRLAREGFTTLVISYSKRTTGAVIRDDAQRERLEQIAVDGLCVLQTDPRLDADRTGVIRLSLGGYLAMHAATAAPEFSPKAVVVYYGVYTLAEPSLKDLRAPLLILQGDNDSKDFVETAKRVKEVSTGTDSIREVVLYLDAVHQFDLFQANSAATRDAWDRTIKFLKHHLGPTA